MSSCRATNGKPRGVVRVRVNPREDADRWWKHAARLAKTSPMFARTLRALEATDEDVTASEAWLVGQACPTDVPLYVPRRHVQDGAIGVPLTKGERDTLTAAALRTGASETAFVRACLAWAIAPKADGAKGHPLDTYRHWVWHGTPGDRHPSRRRFMVPRFDVSSIVREAFVRHGEPETTPSRPSKAA